MAIDPITSNFVLTLVGIGVGSLISLIAACSKCMLKSRCTNIKTPCIQCDRDVINENNSVYDAERTSDESSTPKNNNRL